jgi:hypothetical protein
MRETIFNVIDPGSGKGNAMTETHVTAPYTLTPDDKVVPVMLYTRTHLYMGEVVVKNAVRISTWLRTNTAPDRVTLYNSRIITTTSSTPPKPLQFSEVNVSATEILAWHMVPPNKDPLDYDPTEPNRKMEPVTLLVGTFRVDGCLRLASSSSMVKFLEVTRENFTGVYDATITNTVMTGLKPMVVPFMIIKQDATIFIHP